MPYIIPKNIFSEINAFITCVFHRFQLAYARAKEADNRFAEAVVAYESARDYDNAVRVYLDHLNDPESAVKIVKNTHSTEGAKLVARYRKLSYI